MRASGKFVLKITGSPLEGGDDRVNGWCLAGMTERWIATSGFALLAMTMEGCVCPL